VTVEGQGLRYLIDSYLDWARREGVPIVEGIGVDLFSVPMAPWPRYGDGVSGALVHLAGRGDFVGLQVIELVPGARTPVMRRQFDEVYCVLSGHGSARIEAQDGAASFEWGPRALFSPPLNAPYTLFNGSGVEPARLVCASNLPFAMNFFRNERFLFDCPFDFPDRTGPKKYFAGEGDFLSLSAGKHMWEANFVPDLGSFALPEWEARGAGSRNIKIILADSPMHAHVSEMPVGAYKKAHRHGPGAHVLALTGSGYTLLWREGDEQFERHEWRFGYAFAPPDGVFHQHFNTGREPARYLAASLGSHRYPVLTRKIVRKTAPDASIRDGGLQIDYADQDPRIHRMWLADLAGSGVASSMGRYFDEDAIRSEAP
jgi:mannose-6-phosphate isomerase-like protein (cupin superfamily)